MKLLLIGLLLWSGAHLFQRLAPRLRASMGARAKGIVAIVSVLGVLDNILCVTLLVSIILFSWLIVRSSSVKLSRCYQ